MRKMQFVGVRTQPKFARKTRQFIVKTQWNCLFSYIYSFVKSITTALLSFLFRHSTLLSLYVSRTQFVAFSYFSRPFRIFFLDFKRVVSFRWSMWNCIFTIRNLYRRLEMAAQRRRQRHRQRQQYVRPVSHSWMNLYRFWRQRRNGDESETVASELYAVDWAQTACNK